MAAFDLASLSRRLATAFGALAVAAALAGCNTDEVNLPEKAMRPLSPQMISLLESKNMPKQSPILVRLYKEEAELEVWKQDADGRYQLLKSYPICRWSGELGPKIKEGDRQAPEGFYTITPAQMNPNSSYFLSFNLGYPNAYDRANDRTGSFLMIHGDCSSRGCYAMTDDQIAEIYSLGRESFFGGQKAFQVQAYPFHMTAENMAHHRNSPHMAFWRMIKEGSDYFEVTRQEPKVDVCERHYVFGNEPGATPVHFDPRGKCPPISRSPEISQALQEKQLADEREFASLVSRNVATAPIRTGTDGGTNPALIATWMEKSRALGKDPVVSTDSEGRMATGYALASAESKPVQQTRVASASSSGGSNFFGNLFSFGAKTDTAPENAAADGPVPLPRPAPRQLASMAPVHAAAAKPAVTKPTERTAQTAPQAPAPQPAVQQQQAAAIAGAATPVPSGSFNSRWEGLR
jgi:murein L,D-transpeptidase YafK